MAEHTGSEELFGAQPRPPGERLRQARVAQGLTIADIAARTRVPTRHLEAIETGDYSGLPSPTYAIGFTRAYARAVDLDEATLAQDVRQALDNSWQRESARPSYDLADPARVPSRGLAVGGLIVALLVMIAAGVWFGTDWLRSGAPQPEPSPAAAQAAPAASLAVPPPGGTAREAPADGQVTLTATDAVWLRIYDAKDTTLVMREMRAGERYDVPPDAERPMINVGRPDKLIVTVNGSQVPPLGDGRRAIMDVPVDAASLMARGTGATPAREGGSGRP